MHRIYEWFYRTVVHPVDPGLFIARYAGKAILACLAALAVAWPFPREYALWFVFSAFAVMMSRSGDTFRQRKITAASVFGGAALLVPLSTVAGHSTPAASAYIFLLTFCAFFAGVLGRNFAVGGLWILCVNVLTVCSPDTLAAGVFRSLAVLAGGATAYAVNFWLWPVRPRKVIRECGAVAVTDIADFFAAVAESFERPDSTGVEKARDRARDSVKRYRRIMEAMSLDPLAGMRGQDDRMSNFYIVLVRVFKAVVALSQNSGFAVKSPLFAGIRKEFAKNVDEAAQTFARLAGLLEAEGGRFEAGRLSGAVEALEQGLLNLGAYKRGEGVREEFLEAWGAVYAMKNLAAELEHMARELGEENA